MFWEWMLLGYAIITALFALLGYWVNDRHKIGSGVFLWPIWIWTVVYRAFKETFK